MRITVSTHGAKHLPNCAVPGRIAGGAVVPDAPQYADPCSGQDAHGVRHRRLRIAIVTWADNSRHASRWAALIYQRARARGARHPRPAGNRRHETYPIDE